MDKKQTQLFWLLIANICSAIISVSTAIYSNKDLRSLVSRERDVVVQCDGFYRGDENEVGKFDLAKGE